jgi:hypothetical protein
MSLKIPLYNIIERLVRKSPEDRNLGAEEYEGIELEAQGLIPYY